MGKTRKRHLATAATLIVLVAGVTHAQSPTLTLPQQRIPLEPPQFGGQTPEQAYQDPCQLTLQNQFYANLAAGGGFPVSDALTEANTGELVAPTISTEQNTDVSAQLAFNKCLAERQARLNNIKNATEPSPWDASGDQSDPQVTAPEQ